MDRIIAGAMGLVVIVWIISRMKPDLLPASFSAFMPASEV